MARFLYQLLFTVLLPFMLLKLWRRGKANPAYRKRWLERLGYCPEVDRELAAAKRVQDAADGLIWIHAVSVGEAQAAAPLVKRLLERWPNHQILMTCMTPTGSDQIKRLFADKVLHCYLPYDQPALIAVFLRHKSPDALIIMETELWPNLIAACAKRGIPVMLANARLSEKSAAGYRKLSALTRPMLKRLSRVAVQNSIDGQRFLDLGLSPEQLMTSGSIKFDVQTDGDMVSTGLRLRELWGSGRPVLALASSHSGEDEQLLDIFSQVENDVPGLLLLLIPRHPERFASVSQAIESSGLRFVRRSSNGLPTQNTQVYLADTMGEMMNLLAASDLVLMGGSLVSAGGHNPIEPAALGKAVLMGPHGFNFQTIIEDMARADALLVTDQQRLAADVTELLTNDQKRETMGRAGKALVEQNRGAVDRLEAELKRLLTPDP